MTEATPPLLIAPPPPGWTAQAASSPEADRLAKRALVFGIVAFVVNPLFIASIIGITYGRKALRLGTTNRSAALAGVVTGWVSLGVAVASIAVLLPLSLVLRGMADTLTQHEVETSLVSMASHQGVALTDVACPTPHDPHAGTEIVCTAQAGAMGAVRIDVAFTGSTTFTAHVETAG